HSVHIDEIGAHLLPEYPDYLLRLSLTEKAMVDMDTGELITDSLDEQRGHHGGIHAAAEGQQHLLIPYLAADQFHLVGDKVLHIPVGLRLAGVKHESTNGLLPLLAVMGQGGAALVIHRPHRQAAAVHRFTG